MKLLNAFSPNMMAVFPASVRFDLVTEDEARRLLQDGVDSAVGHADTAAVFSSVLGVSVQCVRSTVTLDFGDTALLGQYRGPRLPEGATTLPEGATIQWLLVKIS